MTRNLLSPSLAELLGDPFPWARPPLDPPTQYSRLRAEAPVARVVSRAGQPMWLVSRYDDVQALLTDPRVSASMTHPGFPRIDTPPLETDQIPFHRADPVTHRTVRKLLLPHFAMRRVEQLQPRIRQLTDHALDSMLARPDRRADLVSAFAQPVSAAMLCMILGVPESEIPMFTRASDEAMNTHNPDDADAMSTAAAAVGRIFGLLGRLAAERAARPDPGDDVLGTLVAAAGRGEITMDEVLSAGFVLIVAGHDTTANMISTGMVTLLSHPDQLAALRADPGLLPNAVEELLRYLTVVHLIVVRVATADIEIGGTVIPAGEGIVPLISSADRDSDRFPDADRLDVRRSADNHLAFGHGGHFCIGAQLARLQLVSAFEALMRRAPGLTTTVPFEDLPFKVWSPVNGLFDMPVRW